MRLEVEFDADAQGWVACWYETVNDKEKYVSYKVGLPEVSREIIDKCIRVGMLFQRAIDIEKEMNVNPSSRS